ncbi:Sodium-coupled neutral amino acid transporter 2 [Hondaea fermentalgiana]|uniref:Sodium-coupled neutral amino acid transporter 2 n=1 Tax=Hondaea fermentalgiana TaxID=2315210 RepID=A0A2R5GBQ6_9STRA|nr:Sodium-coupled neutral amino acid transporter 2 [Hondaea fermentalgiana]|eukprot:GBG27769.1 Sodium-coupled neutral amino acid transporter 2 [Hondaea fermentalgiana]
MGTEDVRVNASSGDGNASSKIAVDSKHLVAIEDQREEQRDDNTLTSAWGTARSLINAAVSGGVLALSYQIPRAGFGLVTLLMLVSAFLLYETLMMLYKTTLLLRVSSYTGAVRKLWGRRAERGVALSLTLGQFGILVGYANVLRDTIPWVIQYNVMGCVDSDENCDLPVYLRSWFLITIIMLVFIVPLSLRSDPDLFANISFTTFVHFGAFLVLVCYGASIYHVSNLSDSAVYTEDEALALGLPIAPNLYPSPSDGAPAPFIFSDQAVLVLAILAFAMEAHTTGLEILYGTRMRPEDQRPEESPDDHKIRVTSLVVAGSFAAVFVYYLIIMLGAYMAFGPKVKDNALNSFPSSDIFAQVIRCTYTFELGTSVPIYVYAMRRDLTASLFNIEGGQADIDRVEKENPKRTIFITLTLLVLSTVLGVLGTLSIILGLTGAIVTALNTYVFPSMLYYTFAKQQGNDGWEFKVSLPLAIFGVLVSIIALYSQINLLVN